MRAPTQANMAVAFVGAPPPSVAPGIPGFRSVLLNISAVRVNPHPNASLSDPRWVTIPVSPGTGNGIGPSPGDLQIDLNNLRTGATLFNTNPIPVGTYSEIQVVVDPNTPGTIIPACQSQNVNQEGCTNYPIVFSTPSQPVTINLSSPISASKGGLAVLLLQLSLTIDTVPTAPGGAYGVTVSAATVDPGSFLGLVTGTVHQSGTPATAHTSALSVSAELSGTNTVVAKVPVTSGSFSLELPAFPVAGTTYDLFVSGGGFTVDAVQGITVFAGSANAPIDFGVTATGLGTVSGTISDVCTGAAISGATVQLLAPPSGSSADCSTAPQSCVSVATTSTDEAGVYPLPLTRSEPSPFNQVPTVARNLAIEVSASGYETLISSVTAGASGADCPGSTVKGLCSFPLLTSFITGNVTLSQAPPPGQSVQVQVFAENSGTNQLVSALPATLTFGPGQTTAPFTLNVPVPSAGTTPVFDLFAAAIDPFMGGPDPFPGHTIEVAAAVPGQTSQCQTTSGVSLGPLDCVGHGSISGTVANPDVGTTLEVLENGVQILGTPAGLFSSAPGAPNNQFTLCVPPGLYTLQRFEQSGVSTPPSPGVFAAVTVPTPSPVSTPCPSTCSSTSDGSLCPGQCFATQANL